MEHVKELLSEYIDGALGPGDKSRVQAHLDACGECRAGLEDMRSVSKMVASLPRRPLPVGFMERLRRRREEAARGKTGFALIPLWRQAPARVAAFALSGILVTFVVYEKAADRLFSGAMGGAVSGASAGGRPQEASEADRLPRFNASRPGAVAGVRGELKGARGLAAPAPFREDLSDKDIGEPLAEGASERAAGGAGAGAGGKAAHTNESLQAYLETEKKRMGIQKILARGAPPEPQETRVPPEYARSIDEARGHMRQMAAELQQLVQARKAPTVPIQGSRPSLLSKPEDGMPAAGGPVAAREEEFRRVQRPGRARIAAPDAKKDTAAIAGGALGAASDELSPASVPASRAWSAKAAVAAMPAKLKKEQAPISRDASSLDLGTGTNVEIMVRDQGGRRTGFDPQSGRLFQEMPGSASFVGSIADDETGEEGAASQQVSIPQFRKGRYELTIKGNQDGPYEIVVRAFSSDGSDQKPVTISGTIKKDAVEVMTLVMDPTPGSQVVVIRKAGSR